MTGSEDVRRVRRRGLVDGVGISFVAFAFGVVYGLAARETGLSFVEAVGMSPIAFAGAAEFAAPDRAGHPCLAGRGQRPHPPRP